MFKYNYKYKVFAKGPQGWWWAKNNIYIPYFGPCQCPDLNSGA